MLASLVFFSLALDGLPCSRAIKIHRVNSNGIVEQYVSNENETQDTQRNSSDDIESSLTRDEIHEQAYGLTSEHYNKLQGWADKHDEIIVLRRTEALSLNRIKYKYPTKSVDVHDKSSDWGPHAGYVPIDPFFAKVKAGSYPKMGPVDTEDGFGLAFDKKISHAMRNDTDMPLRYKTGVRKVKLQISDIMLEEPIGGPSRQLATLRHGNFIVRFKPDDDGNVVYQLQVGSNQEDSKGFSMWRVYAESSITIYKGQDEAFPIGKELFPSVVYGRTDGKWFQVLDVGFFKIGKKTPIVEPFDEAIPYYPLYVWAYMVKENVDGESRPKPVTGDYDLWQIAPHVGGAFCRYEAENVELVDTIFSQSVIGGRAAQSAFLSNRLTELNRFLKEQVEDQQHQVFNHGPEMYNFKFLQELDDMLTFIVPNTERASKVKGIVPGGPVIVPYLGPRLYNDENGRPDRNRYMMLSDYKKMELVNEFKADWEKNKNKPGFELKVLKYARELANTVLEFQKQGYIFHTNVWYGAAFVEFGGQLLVQRSPSISGGDYIPASPQPQSGLKYDQVKAFSAVLDKAYRDSNNAADPAIQYHRAWVPVYKGQAENKLRRSLDDGSMTSGIREVLPPQVRQDKLNLEFARNNLCTNVDEYGRKYQEFRQKYIDYWNRVFGEKASIMEVIDNMPSGNKRSKAEKDKFREIEKFRSKENEAFRKHMAAVGDLIGHPLTEGGYGALRYDNKVGFRIDDWYKFVGKAMLPKGHGKSIRK